MEVALEQRGVNDLQQLLLGFDGGSAFHKRGGARLVIRVIQLLYQLASFLPRPGNVGLRPGLNHPSHLGYPVIPNTANTAHTYPPWSHISTESISGIKTDECQIATDPVTIIYRVVTTHQVLCQEIYVILS